MPIKSQSDYATYRYNQHYNNGSNGLPGLNRPQNLGPAYDSLLDANPYLPLINQRKQTGWESFLSMLGFRSGYDKDIDMLTAQANEHYAKIVQQAYDEQFNSPTAQAERLRAAGINPDLSGNVGPGEAQTPGQDMSVPQFDDSNPVAMLQSFGQAIIGCFQGGLALVDSVSGVIDNFRQRSASNEIRGLKTETDLNDMFDSIFRSLVGSEPYDVVNIPDGDDYKSIRVPLGTALKYINEHNIDGATHSDWRSDFINDAHAAIRRLPKKYHKKGYARFQDFLDSAPQTADAWKAWAETASNRTSYLSNEDNTFRMASGVLSDVVDCLQSARKEMFDLLRESSKSDLDLNKLENEKRTNFLDKADTAIEGEATTEKNKLERANNAMMAKLREALEKIVNKLESRTHAGGFEGTFAECVLTLVSVLQLQMASSSSPLISTSRKEFNTNYNGSYTRVNGQTGEIY